MYALLLPYVMFRITYLSIYLIYFFKVTAKPDTKLVYETLSASDLTG
jgi:hypothetical protein